MAEDTREDRRTGLSRREMLSVGAAIPTGLAAAAANAAPAPETPAGGRQEAPPLPAGTASGSGSTSALEALETLTSREMKALEAVCARLVPTDDRGPGAKEARAARYIDRALAGPVAHQRGVYAAGLSALDDYARTARGRSFADLAPSDQDAVLRDLEADKAPGFASGSAAFFGLVRTHTLEGMFCDPYYGGNADFIGWDLVGYPGLRMMVKPQDQRFVKPKALRQSAYSVDLFGHKSDG